MAQENPSRKIRKNEQMLQALELRRAGASYQQIANALSVSKTRAWKIVKAALDELVQQRDDTAERVRELELYRLNKLRLALDPKKSDPRVADTLIRISAREAKLRGLDAPQKTELSGPNGGPIQTEEEKPDYSRLTVDELRIFLALDRKAHGDPDWDADIRYYGTDEYVRQWPGKPLSFITVFAKGLLGQSVSVDAR